MLRFLLSPITKMTYVLILIFGLALALRLALTPWAIHPDLTTQAGWGSWMFTNGIFDFYINDQWIYGWPNHPPLITLEYGFGFVLHEWLSTLFANTSQFIALNRLAPTYFLWFFDFTRWFDSTLYSDTPYKYGELMSLKLVPILADMIVGAIIFIIARQKTSFKMSAIWTAVYFFSPFSWYLSGIWGQTDQLSFIFLFLALVLLHVRRWSWLAPVLFVISIGFKPTTLIFTPLFVGLSLTSVRATAKSLIGWIIAAIGGYFVIRLFTDQPVFEFLRNLSVAIFVKGELWTWVSAFNFWRFTTPYLTPYKSGFGFLTFEVASYALFLGVTLIALVYAYNKKLFETYVALYIVGFAGFLFLPAMHERYMYTALVMGLILCIYNKKMIPYWIVMSVIYLINMYHGWWYPQQLEVFQKILTSPYEPLVKVLSIVNFLIFLKTVSFFIPYRTIVPMFKETYHRLDKRIHGRSIK